MAENVVSATSFVHWYGGQFFFLHSIKAYETHLDSKQSIIRFHLALTHYAKHWDLVEFLAKTEVGEVREDLLIKMVLNWDLRSG